MTLEEAMVAGNFIRRKGKLWVNKDILQAYTDVWCLLDFGVWLTQEDIDATDWEAKIEKSI